MATPIALLRINRYFTEHGICSRREADQLVAAGRVTINGNCAKPGDKVTPKDVVALDGRRVPDKAKKPVILAYHKPPGIICTTDLSVEDNLTDAVGYPDRIFNVGRLDRFSEGLLLLTNRGEIVNKVLRSRYGHEKEYIVDLNGPVDDRIVKRMASGIVIQSRRTLPCLVEQLGPRRVRIVLTEGRNRQIRRMAEEVGLRVSRLKRVRIMELKLGDLPRGEYRELTRKETDQFLKALEDKAKTVEASGSPYAQEFEDFADE
jgi:23S rRNA pseudouridine2604 synthase